MRRLFLNRGGGQKERPKHPEKSLPDNNRLSEVMETLAELPLTGDQVV
jgi:hypothetical protein